MKKFSFLLLLLALFGTGFSFAQTGDTNGEESMADIPQGHILSIFSQDGAPFWLVLNGVKQSDKPSARVKVVKEKGCECRRQLRYGYQQYRSRP